MKAILFILLMMITPAGLIAQNVPYQVSFSCQTSQPLLAFNYNSIDEMLHPSEIVNAIQLHLRLKMRGCTVMARVDYTNSTHPIPAGWMSTKLISNTSPNVSIPSIETPLSNSNTLLFTQPGHQNNGPHDYTFNYNLKLNALSGECVHPGMYNFTITYTMTQL